MVHDLIRTETVKIGSKAVKLDGINAWKIGIGKLVGKELKSINVCREENSNYIELVSKGASSYYIFHDPSCSENVYIESIVGDINDLIDTPIILAEVSSNTIDPAKGEDLSYMWTFYRFRTVKGNVDIRWYGESNGYYSEEVDIVEIMNQ